MVCAFIPCLLLLTSLCGFKVLLMYEHDLNVGHKQSHSLTQIQFSITEKGSRHVD